MYLLIRRKELLLLLPIVIGLLLLLAARGAAQWSDNQVIAYNSGLSSFVAGDLDQAQKQSANSLLIYNTNKTPADFLNPGPSLEAAARANEMSGLIKAASQDSLGALQDFQTCITIVEDAHYKGRIAVSDAHAVDLIEMECRYNFELILTSKSAPSQGLPVSGQGGNANSDQQAPLPAQDGQPNLGSGKGNGSGL